MATMRAGISVLGSLTSSPTRIPSRGYWVRRPTTPRQEIISGANYIRRCTLGYRIRLIRSFGPLFPSRVPPDTVWVIERFGKHHRTLYPGYHWFAPIIDKVRHMHALEERNHQFLNIPCVSRDKVDVLMSGHLYTKVIDPMLASYSISDPIYATRVQAETKLQAEMGRITISRFLDEKDAFIDNYLILLNATVNGWGIKCTGFEIKNLEFLRDVPVAGAKVSFIKVIEQPLACIIIKRESPTAIQGCR